VTGPQLDLRTDATLALDECLIAVLTVLPGDEPVRVSARLNLIEGDLVVTVTGPGGTAARCAWPWPVDSQGRQVDLAPGRRLVGAVPLIGTDASTPLFASPGAYTVVAEYDAAPGLHLSSAPVTVRRTPAADEARAAALRDREVIQSLLSASVLGSGEAGLWAVAEGSRAATRTLAALALDQVERLGLLADADEQTRLEIAAAVDAVLPEGVADADPRRIALLAGRA
jgi:hypothetical protein